jgi:hypothetical protein
MGIVEFEIRWWRELPCPFRPALGPTPPPVKWGPGLKQPASGADHTSTSSVEVKERVELYLCSPSSPSWPVIEGNLALIYKFLMVACLRVEVLKKYEKKRTVEIKVSNETFHKSFCNNFTVRIPTLLFLTHFAGLSSVFSAANSDVMPLVCWTDKLARNKQYLKESICNRNK